MQVSVQNAPRAMAARIWADRGQIAKVPRGGSVTVTVPGGARSLSVGAFIFRSSPVAVAAVRDGDVFRISFPLPAEYVLTLFAGLVIVNVARDLLDIEGVLANVALGLAFIFALAALLKFRSHKYITLVKLSSGASSASRVSL